MAALAAAAGLRELVVDKCLDVTDVGLAKVAVGCPGLEKLSVKWCREISDIGIERLAKKCPCGGGWQATGGRRRRPCGRCAGTSAARRPFYLSPILLDVAPQESALAHCAL